MTTHEEALIRAFICPPRRQRWLEALSSRKRRQKIVDRLNHCRDLDERFATEIKSNTNIAALLSARGAPKTCYVLSDVPELDRREMLLEDALNHVELAGFGTLIGCIPGRLAYYYGELGERRVLLERKTP